MGCRRNIAAPHAEPVGLPPPLWQETLWRKVARIEALTKQHNRCAYCHEPLTARTATADHVIPQSKGGRTTRHNISASCLQCNAAKGAMPVEKFKKLLRSTLPHPNIEILLARFRFRLWSRVEKAERRIAKFAGIAA